MSLPEQMRQERLKKKDLLEQYGMEAYPSDCLRTHTNTSFKALYSSLEASAEVVTLAGRIMSFRDQGGLVFVDIFDGTDTVQVIVKKDTVETSLFELFVGAVDQSDFIEVTGNCFTTNRGVQSLLATSWRMLAKSLQQVPDAWFGIKDEDERYRKRYIDMLLDPRVRDLARKRSVFWNAIRTFLLERGFIEVETPVLDTKTGGAEARPFASHHNALDMDIFLRISLELPLKKLCVAGVPRVFEIGRVFRNEGMSAEHAQDFTFVEFYASFMDSREGVPLLMQLYKEVAEKTFGKTVFEINGHTVDFAGQWKELDYGVLMEEAYGFDIHTVTKEEVHEHLSKHSIAFDPKSTDVGRGVDLLWKRIRKTIAGPAVMTGMPVYLEPLAKKSKTDTREVDRFQLIIAGSELGKAFNELNDPIDQHDRFMHQQSLRDAGDDEAQMADMEYVEAMEYGMPPMFGFGVSERFFSFLNGTSIREAQLFPLMRPRNIE
jgi:lysyl-tRNA synthetase class 2